MRASILFLEDLLPGILMALGAVIVFILLGFVVVISILLDAPVDHLVSSDQAIDAPPPLDRWPAIHFDHGNC